MAIAPHAPAPPLSARGAALSREAVSARELVAAVHAVLDGCGDVAATPGSVASGLVGDVDRAIARLSAVRLALVAAVDRDQVAAQTGLSGTPAWLASRSRSDSCRAAREVRLATALERDLPATKDALASGVVSTEHAHVIASAAAQLPDGLRRAERQAIEAALVERAKLVDPAALATSARRALAAAARSQAQVDAHEDRLLRTEQDAALARTRLTLHDNRDGTVTGHFTVPTLAGHILRKVVQQIASPRRFAQHAARTARENSAPRAAGTVRAPGATGAGLAAGAGGAGLATGAGGATLSGAQVRAAQWDAFRRGSPSRTDDTGTGGLGYDTNWAHRYGTAFVELLEHLPTDHLSGKVNATVVVTIDHDQLKTQLGAAHLDTGHDLSAGDARRLACNAGILPAVLGAGSVPLDLGRQTRFFTEPQRLALATTYDTCAAHGCDRPYAWSELHHQDPWSTGGTTNLSHAVPLCGHHHRRIHDPDYGHHIHTDQHGIKTVTYRRRT